MKKKFSFANQINRIGTDSYKWGKGSGFNIDQIIPMWVADMDFACPQPVVDAVIKRAQHPIYGYTVRSDEYVDCVVKWIKRRHGFELPCEWIVFVPPGVLYGIASMLRLLTKKDDSILVMMPNYEPLHAIVTSSDRKLIESNC